MKYIKSILMGALAMLSFTACTGDQALPPINKPEALGDGNLGNGDWNTPMAAYQAALGTVPHDDYGYDKTEAWVTGYIVGWVNVDISNSNLALAADFTVPAQVNTNIMIASDPDEKDPANIATVQLPSGDVRKALNLQDHPENLGELVTVYGTVGIKYCGQYGVRSVSDYVWGDEGKEPDPNMVLPAGAREFFSVDLTKGMEGFTFDQGNPADKNGNPLSDFKTWTQSTQYGLVATGGIANNDFNKSKANITDAMAISPVIDLTDYTQIRMMVHQAGNYFNNADNFQQMTSTLIREAGSTEWEQLEVPYPPAGNSWTFSNSGYIVLDDYAGKKVEIGFRYTSTSSLSGTWEIDKVTVAGVYSR